MYLHTLGLVSLLLGHARAKLVRETLEFTWGSGSPNGASPRPMVYTNNQYPGPDLIFDEGDDVEVHVINYLPFNTTVHWHGLEMRETPWADGVPGLSQTPISPNSSQTYKFKASPAGTFWYHSHFKGLMQDGQVGGLYIRRKPDATRPYSLITKNHTEIAKMRHAEAHPDLLVITDWTSLPSCDYYQAEAKSGFNLFCVDSLLVNGRGSTYCPGAKFLHEVAPPAIELVLEGTNLTEKGCLVPNLFNVQGTFGGKNESAVPRQIEFDCTPSKGNTTVIHVDPQRGWASLNFIAAQAEKGLTFSIDDHPMWVYEVDGQFVEPRQVEMVGMFNGARYAVMIKLDQTPGNYTIRVADNGGDQVMSAYAILSYKGAHADNATSIPQASLGPRSKGYMDYGGQNTSASVRQLLFTENLPAFSVPLPPHSVNKTLRTKMKRINHSYTWSLGNDILYQTEMTKNTPLLYQSNPLSALGANYTLYTLNDTWVDIILEIHADTNDPIHPPHPIHKHGNRAYIIGHGIGKFNWTTAAEAMEARPELFYLDKPALRDTFTLDFFDSRVDSGQWMVIRYHVQGPFASVLHCHIATHQEGGMSLALLDGLDVWSELSRPSGA